MSSKKTSSKKAARANPATPAPGPIRLEDYQVEFVGPFLGLLLTGVSYYFWRHYERLEKVGWLESLLVGAGLAVVCITLLYLPQILYKAFNNKFYISVAIMVLLPSLFVLSMSAWRTWEYFNTFPLHEGTTPVIPNIEESDSPIFDGNCQNYAKEILARAILTSPHKVKGQVDTFQRSIFLAGQPIGLLLIRKLEYRAQAMYIMWGRVRHTDAVSHFSAEDAVEKALTKMCEIFQTEGL